jgi:hypothetical protein
MTDYELRNLCAVSTVFSGFWEIDGWVGPTALKTMHWPNDLQRRESSPPRYAWTSPGISQIGRKKTVLIDKHFFDLF